MQQKERGWRCRLWFRREQAPFCFFPFALGVEKQHSDLDRTLSISWRAKSGLQGVVLHFGGVMAPHKRAGPRVKWHPTPPLPLDRLRISLRWTAQKGKLGN